MQNGATPSDWQNQLSGFSKKMRKKIVPQNSHFPLTWCINLLHCLANVHKSEVVGLFVFWII